MQDKKCVSSESLILPVRRGKLCLSKCLQPFRCWFLWLSLKAGVWAWKCNPKNALHVCNKQTFYCLFSSYTAFSGGSALSSCIFLLIEQAYFYRNIWLHKAIKPSFLYESQLFFCSLVRWMLWIFLHYYICKTPPVRPWSGVFLNKHRLTVAVIMF